MKEGEVSIAEWRNQRDVRAVVLLWLDSVSRNGGGAVPQEAWCVVTGLFQFDSGRCGKVGCLRTNTRSTIVYFTRRKRGHQSAILRKRSFTEPGMMNGLLCLPLNKHSRSPTVIRFPGLYSSNCFIKSIPFFDSIGNVSCNRSDGNLSSYRCTTM